MVFATASLFFLSFAENSLGMKLSKKSEYACLAMIELAEGFGDSYLKIEQIASKWHIPRKFLEQILVSLKNAGYLSSRKGADGGYKLIKKPENISIAEIVRLIDGALAPVESASVHYYNSSPSEQSPALLSIFVDIRNYISNKLEKTTLRDLIRR